MRGIPKTIFLDRTDSTLERSIREHYSAMWPHDTEQLGDGSRVAVIGGGPAGGKRRMHACGPGRQVQALLETPEGAVELEILKPGDMFGEMALFTNTPYEATYIAKGPARIITIDKKLFLKRITEDPTLAFHPVRELALRIQALETELQHLKADAS